MQLLNLRRTLTSNLILFNNRVVLRRNRAPRQCEDKEAIYLEHNQQRMVRQVGSIYRRIQQLDLLLHLLHREGVRVGRHTESAASEVGKRQRGYQQEHRRSDQEVAGAVPESREGYRASLCSGDRKVYTANLVISINIASNKIIHEEGLS